MPAPQCMMPECKCKEIRSRGLCPKCYTMSARLVREGKTTWKKLIAKGYALDARQGPPLTNPASIAILGQGQQAAT